MATFGVEAVRHFNNARASGEVSGPVVDSWYTFNRSNGFYQKLSDAGHWGYYYTQSDVWETDFTDRDQGGEDDLWADNVDLIWIETLGANDSGVPRILFDIKRNSWESHGSRWQFGEGTQLEWLMAFCKGTVDRNKIGGLWQIFAGLHIYCGLCGLTFYDGSSIDECGEDVAQYMIDGDPVAEAWIDGVSDWWIDNFPIVVCPINAQVYNNGNIRYEQSYLSKDHLWGHGATMADPKPSDTVRLLYRWTEG